MNMSTLPVALRQNIAKADTIVEALPYIQAFCGKIFVVKYGGSAMTDPAIAPSILSDLALMQAVGIKVVVVHGGGPAINSMLDELGKEPSYNNGLRVTDDDTMRVVEMVLAGQINKKVVSDLNQLNARSIGLSGRDASLLVVSKKLVKGADIGWVGSVELVQTDILSLMLDNGIIPVIAPVGTDTGGQSYNINADEVAVAVAGALKAEKLLFLTDVPGVLKDINDPESLISKLSVSEAAGLIQEKIISGGMIPKVNSAVDGIQAGVGSVHILDGRLPHALLVELFTEMGIGTMFVRESL